jgi:hypothetical protein
MSIANIRRGRGVGPSQHSYNTTHGLEVVTGPDVARIALPAASQLNGSLLDAAAGHVGVYGAVGSETVFITMGIRLQNGWQYEPGSTVGRVIQLNPDGSVAYYLVTGTPMNWYLQMQLDGYGDLLVSGNLRVDGQFTPAGPLSGGGPNGTVRMKRSMARYVLATDTNVPASAYTNIPFDTVDYDTAGFTGKVPHVLVTPIAGYYSMRATVTFAAASAPGNSAGIRFYLNDRALSGGSSSIMPTQVPLTLHASLTVHCVANDGIMVQEYSSVPALIAGSGGGWTWCEVIYEGE